MTVQEEALQLIASRRDVARTILARDGASSLFVRAQVPPALRMLDEIEANIRAGIWPPQRGTYNGPLIGLYAVRTFAEIDGGILLDTLCPLANLLDGFPPSGSGGEPT